MVNPGARGALDGIRVVELGHGIAGPYAARLLADLGADVVKVEPPGKGEFGRLLGPVDNRPDPGPGLLFQFLNWNKRGMALDLSAPEAAEPLRRLVSDADIVIESFRPGRLAGWGFGPDQLREWNPRLVVTSVSNFGQHGPRSDWHGSDLVFAAMSGVMHMSGKKWPAEPLKHGLRQSLYAAGLTAAYASLVGYLGASRTGTGTHIDLAIRECVAAQQVTPLSYYIFTGLIPGRQPAVEDPFNGDPIDMPGGQISIQAPPACPIGRYADLLDLDLLRTPQYVATQGRIADAARIRVAVEERLREWRAKDFFLASSRQGLITALVQDATALLECEHLAEREVFQPLPGHERVRMPVELARLRRTPVRVHRPAPRLGEHDEEILAEPSARVDDRTGGRAEGRTDATVSPEHTPPAWKAGEPDLPLRGLRVVDLSNVVAGPYLGGLLADLGADVIKVEGPNRADPARGAWGPLLDNVVGDDPWNRGGAYQMLNRGKRSFVCDLSTERGRQLLTKLLSVSDVLIENFTPRVLRNWGFTPEALEAINPRLITFSNSGYGATGPWRDFRAQGTTLEVMMGISWYTGYRGGRPAKAGQSYPDFPACWSGMLAVMAALVHRERTGLGQSIDQGMYQLGAALIPEALLAVQAGGDDLGRCGAEDFDKVLSGVFESADQDVWVAVSVADSAALATVRRVCLGQTTGSDVDDVDAVRAALARWVGQRRAEDAAAVLQTAGIAAGKVMSVADLVDDAHLTGRGFCEPVDFGDGQPRPVIGRAFQFRDGFRAHVGGRAPRFGEHNRAVLTELLGLGAEEIGALYAEGVVSDRPSGSAGARQVDVDVLTGAGGSFAAVHRDYLSRLRDWRRRRADAAGAADSVGHADAVGQADAVGHG